MSDEKKQDLTVKPATTFEEQVNILKSRGLEIENEKEAAQILEYTNYYRLRGYYIHLQKDGSDDFIDGTSFNQICALHDFDNELRHLLLKVLLNIEIVARARIAYSIAHAWGPMGYREESNYGDNKHDKFESLMARIDDDLSKSRERFIKTYREKYNGQFPIWVAVEVMSYGDLSKLYALLPTDLKQNIAKAYNELDETLLTNWLLCSAILRNLCAHNSRIYARGIPMPIMIENDVQDKIKEVTNAQFEIKPHSLFSYLLALRRISNSNVWNEFIDEFEQLLTKYNNAVELKRHGIPYQWKIFLEKKL